MTLTDTGSGTAEAMREAARVPRPGGRILVADFRHIAEYELSLRAAG